MFDRDSRDQSAHGMSHDDDPAIGMLLADRAQLLRQQLARIVERAVVRIGECSAGPTALGDVRGKPLHRLRPCRIAVDQDHERSFHSLAGRIGPKHQSVLVRIPAEPFANK